jgi:hypothetical protein
VYAAPNRGDSGISIRRSITTKFSEGEEPPFQHKRKKKECCQSNFTHHAQTWMTHRLPTQHSSQKPGEQQGKRQGDSQELQIEVDLVMEQNSRDGNERGKRKHGFTVGGFSEENP